MKKISLYSMIALILFSVLPMQNLFAEEAINWEHRKELFWKGTITDSGGKVWDVIFIPGFDTVSNDAGSQWVRAGKTVGELGEGRFWDKRYENFKNGMKFARESFTDYWYDGIKNDFSDTVRENETIKPGEFGSVFMPFVNWMIFSAETVGRTITAPIGATGGVLYSILWPTGYIIERPIEAGLRAIGGGTVVPGVLYVWNGFAWVGTTATTAASNVPTKNSFFVHLQYGGHKKSGEFVIDKQGFENIIHASAKQVITQEQVAVIDKKIAAIGDEIKKVTAPYYEKQRELQKQEYSLEETLRADATQKLLNEAISKAYNSEKTTLTPDTRNMYMDQTQLKGLIIAYLKNLGVTSSSNEMVESIVNQINDTLEKMGAEMGKKAIEQQNVTMP